MFKKLLLAASFCLIAGNVWADNLDALDRHLAHLQEQTKSGLVKTVGNREMTQEYAAQIAPENKAQALIILQNQRIIELLEKIEAQKGKK